jgi:hypothetical protein
MRVLVFLAVAIIPAAAQRPMVRLINVTRPAGSDFQIGDRFEIVITGAADQPVSVRTTMNSRTDWGPVIGRTGISGRWSTTSDFAKSDFGDWGEACETAEGRQTFATPPDTEPFRTPDGSWFPGACDRT